MISFWCFTKSKIITIVLLMLCRLNKLVALIVLWLIRLIKSSQLSLVFFLTCWLSLIIMISISWFKFVWIYVCKLRCIKIIWIKCLTSVISTFTAWLIRLIYFIISVCRNACQTLIFSSTIILISFHKIGVLLIVSTVI